MGKIKIARASDVKEGRIVKFPFIGKGKPTEGFLTRFNGDLVCYENRCRHLPLRLDFDDGRFFTPEGDHFICQSHNALYEPSTGLCVRGPCEGESLKALKIEVIDGDVWFTG